MIHGAYFSLYLWFLCGFRQKDHILQQPSSVQTRVQLWSHSSKYLTVSLSGWFKTHRQNKTIIYQIYIYKTLTLNLNMCFHNSSWMRRCRACQRPARRLWLPLWESSESSWAWPCLVWTSLSTYKHTPWLLSTSTSFQVLSVITELCEPEDKHVWCEVF